MRSASPIAERARARIASALAPSHARVELRIDPSLALPAEGFELAIAPDGVRLLARDPRGLNWGASALVQLARQRAPELPCLRLRDWPDLPVRGYMLDVSRDRVPTMDTLAQLVDLLELLRVNQLQLYTEHTFAYRDHARVWEHASPFTADEIRTVDGWCAERGIELVPNQNGFGHMERWLKHEPYTALGELADTGTGPGSTLAPTAESAAFMRGLYAELLPCFREPPGEHRPATSRSSSGAAARGCAVRNRARAACTSSTCSSWSARCKPRGAPSSSGATSSASTAS